MGVHDTDMMDYLNKIIEAFGRKEINLLALFNEWMYNLTGDPKAFTMTVLLTTFIAAAIFGLIANSRKVRQPVILGYILAGVVVVLLSNWLTIVPDAIEDAAAFEKYNNARVAAEKIQMMLNSLCDIGVALLLFSMGLEFSRKDIKPIWGVAVFGSLAQVLFTCLVVSGVMYCLRDFVPELQNVRGGYFLVGACFVSTSTAVVVKCLSAKGHDKALSGRVMIGISIVQDLTVIPLLLLVSQLSEIGSGQLDLKSFAPLIGSVVFIVIMLAPGSKFFPWILKRVAKQESKELFILTVTLIALLSGAVAEMLHVSFSFGAFLAGIALSESDYGKKALSEMISIRDIFALLFFVSIGAMLNIDYLKEHYVLVFVVMLLTSLSRTVFLSIVTWLAKYRNVIPVAMFFGMFPTSEIAFVALAFCKGKDKMPDDCYALVLCAVICSMVAGPLVNELTAPIYNLLRRTVLKNRRIQQNISLPHPDFSEHVIFVGAGAMADRIGPLLQRFSIPCVMIEPIYEQYRKLRDAGKVNAIYGDPLKEHIMLAAGIERARIIVPVCQHETNKEIIEFARTMNPDIRAIVCAESQEDENELRALAANDIILSTFEIMLEILHRILSAENLPQADLLSAIDKMRRDRYSSMAKSAGTNGGDQTASNPPDSTKLQNLIELQWVSVPDGSAISGTTIAHSGIRPQTGVSVVGIIRSGKLTSNPAPGMVIKQGDLLAVIGTPEQMTLFSDFAKHPAPAAVPAQD